MVASILIRKARHSAGLTQTELAARSGTSQTALSAYESGSRNPSVDTLERILAAAGWELRGVPGRRAVHSPGRAELERRGDILGEVLALAERLPAHRRNRLDYPRIESSNEGSA